MVGRAALAIALALGLAAAASSAAAQPAPADWRTPDPETILVMDTTRGRVVIEMAPEIAPLAVARIKVLARRGYYNGAQFYRVLKGYMAQGGEKGARVFRSDLPNLKAEFTFRKGPSSSFVSIGTVPGGDVGFIGSTPVHIGSDGTGYANYCPGVLSLAHGAAAPNTGNSQLFIMTGEASQLERAFTAWGRVVSGLDAVKALNAGEPPASPDRMTRVRVLADIPEAERPPLQLMDLHGPGFQDLLRKLVADKAGGFSLCDIELPIRTG